MSKMIIIEGNSNDKDNLRAFMVKGEPGNDGISPTATVTKTDGVATITITDAEGTTTATISDGEKGEPGATSNIIDSTTLTDDTTQTYSGRIVNEKIADSVIPVHDEYSTSTTEPYSANYVNEQFYTETVLFEGSSNTDITLSESLANFDEAKIYYSVLENNLDVYGELNVVDPDGKRFGMSEMAYMNSTTPNAISHYFANYLASGTSITLNNPYSNNANQAFGRWRINNDTSFTPNYQQTNYIYIKKVVGLKKGA